MDSAPIIDTIMNGFADRTGLDSSVPPRRYLWTDAFAVCNYLGRYRQTNKKEPLRAALTLVEQVHLTLGRHREDDPRSGWISGLSEQEGKAHPTRGGLRIGKSMKERRPGEPFDERLEWDRDGQYFHYLVKWMHAIDCVARITGMSRYNLWALELAKTAHTKFTHTSLFGGRKLLYWKMSVDLSYPLVTSMGQHDPLDGLITYQQLMATASRFSDIPAELDLSREISDMKTMCQGLNWATDDALGIGGLLTDALRLTQLIIDAGLPESDRLVSLLEDAETGLNAFVRRADLDYPAAQRLAFRELGLSVGIHTIEKMRQLAEQHHENFSWPAGFNMKLTDLSRFAPLSRSIESFWLEPAHRQSESWLAHRDINEVMLATSLSPDGYLILD